MRNPAINCYRAILAQVNQLDSIYHPKIYMKEVYIDLTELAYYLLDDDQSCAYKGIEQMYETINEVSCYAAVNNGKSKEINYIIGEIRTHLEYLAMQLMETSSRKFQVQ